MASGDSESGSDAPIGGSDTRRPRVYIRNEVVPFEEDATHEFKGHRNLTMEEIPRFCVDSSSRSGMSRQPISKNLCGFLNNERGGTVYIGIIDNGCVRGLKLTRLQKDHIIVCLDQLLQQRFYPQVPKHRYKVKFVPIVEQNATEEEKMKIAKYDDSVDHQKRQKQHEIFTPHYCFCDREAVALINNGVIPPDYITEIIIPPWDRNDPRNMDNSSDLKTKLRPFYEDESGVARFRRQASTVTYTHEELINLTREEIQMYYEPRIRKLKKQLETLRVAAT